MSGKVLVAGKDSINISQKSMNACMNTKKNAYVLHSQRLSHNNGSGEARLEPPAVLPLKGQTRVHFSRISDN